jgi:hypothetical protein
MAVQAATYSQLYDYAMPRLRTPRHFLHPEVQQRLDEVVTEMWLRIHGPPIADILANSLAEREDVRKSMHETVFGGRIQPILDVRDWKEFDDVERLEGFADTLEDWLRLFHDQYQRDSVPQDNSKVAWTLERIRNRIWELTTEARLAATLALQRHGMHPELIRQMIGPPR